MYSLIGEQLYANKTNPNLGFYQTFDNFYSSFLSIFQVLTVCDWTDLEVLSLNTDTLRGISILFWISLIIIGNYIFLNLFIGILINGFVGQSAVKAEDELEEMNRLKNEEEVEQLKLLETEDGHIVVQRKDRKHKILFEGIECEESLFIFSKKCRIRKYIHLIVLSPNFDTLILVIILLSSIKLALDTYDLFGDYSDPIDIFFNSIFIAEATFKIISNGFCFDQGSYLRSSWNDLDFIIVIISLIDMFLSKLNLTYQKVFFSSFLLFIFFQDTAIIESNEAPEVYQS